MPWAPIPSTSVQYIGVDVSALQAGDSVDPTGDAVGMAFMDSDAIPENGDFQAASWETNTNTTPPTYSALCLLGPGHVELTPGEWQVYVQITDDPEVPVIPVPGILTIL